MLRASLEAYHETLPMTPCALPRPFAARLGSIVSDRSFRIAPFGSLFSARSSAVHFSAPTDSYPTHPPREGVEHPVDELGALYTPIPLGELHTFLNDDAGWRLAGEQLGGAHA